ncbi:succinylglutamate desuccinylase [Streptomyces tsukubensis]|nr:succinylglutamate desuccinylase [Streptomyces tsukubensis]
MTTPRTPQPLRTKHQAPSTKHQAPSTKGHGARGAGSMP